MRKAGEAEARTHRYIYKTGECAHGSRTGEWGGRGNAQKSIVPQPNRM